MMDKEIVLTRSGYERLSEEFSILTSEKRKEIARRLKEAKAFGDLSENAEYEDAKNEQAFIEGRIKSIRHILKYAKVIDEKKLKTDKVRLGLTVTLKDMESGKSRRFRIVHSIEADPDLAQISDESPVGKAVLDRKKGDIVEVKVPHGSLRYQIEEIRK